MEDKFCAKQLCGTLEFIIFSETCISKNSFFFHTVIGCPSEDVKTSDTFNQLEKSSTSIPGCEPVVREEHKLCDDWLGNCTKPGILTVFPLTVDRIKLTIKV